jgi:mRNA-degrading endonuclease toxin of MazEF toxin-antitoxin module
LKENELDRHAGYFGRRSAPAKVSAADVLQLRGMDVQRFVTRIGDLGSAEMDEIAAAVAIVVELKQ